MTNLTLFLVIIMVLVFTIYDQFIMPKRKGDTKLCITLQRQVKLDAWILIALIVLTIIQGVQNGIEPVTLYLLSFSILLCIYTTFIRAPKLLLKQEGFFFGNIFFSYQNIAQINLSPPQIIVVDLKNHQRLLIRLKNIQDVESIVNFFGGYKTEK